LDIGDVVTIRRFSNIPRQPQKLDPDLSFMQDFIQVLMRSKDIYQAALAGQAQRELLNMGG
jgi:hypothetical protein